jgi:hypothetical protein
VSCFIIDSVTNWKNCIVLYSDEGFLYVSKPLPSGMFGSWETKGPYRCPLQFVSPRCREIPTSRPDCWISLCYLLTVRSSIGLLRRTTWWIGHSPSYSCVLWDRKWQPKAASLRCSTFGPRVVRVCGFRPGDWGSHYIYVIWWTELRRFFLQLIMTVYPYFDIIVASVFLR